MAFCGYFEILADRTDWLGVVFGQVWAKGRRVGDCESETGSSFLSMGADGPSVRRGCRCGRCGCGRGKWLDWVWGLREKVV